MRKSYIQREDGTFPEDPDKETDAAAEKLRKEHAELCEEARKEWAREHPGNHV